MFNLKRVFLTTALVVSGALVAPLGAMATVGGPLSTSFLTPAGNTGCTGNNGLGSSFTITPDDGGPAWPIPFANLSGGTSYEFRYTATFNNIPSGINNMKVSLNAGLPTPVMSDGTNEISNFEPACKGSIGHLFAVNVCDARVAPLLTVAGGKVSIFMRDLSAHAPVGGAAVKGGFAGLIIAQCSALEVPIDAPPAFASNPKKIVMLVGDRELCIPLGLDGCGLVPFWCDTPGTPFTEAQVIIDGHILKWAQGSQDGAQCPISLLVGNPPSCTIVVGGRAFPIHNQPPKCP